MLVSAIPAILERYPRARFLIAGRGDLDWAHSELGAHAGVLEALGGISDEEKASMLASVDLYVAPQTGGESFGIVLVEAMSAGACVVSSDLSAFRRVLDDGESGFLFTTSDPASLAETVCRALADPLERERRRAHASAVVGRYDWTQVTRQIIDVYAMVTAGEAAPSRSLLGRLLGGTP